MGRWKSATVHMGPSHGLNVTLTAVSGLPDADRIGVRRNVFGASASVFVAIHFAFCRATSRFTRSAPVKTFVQELRTANQLFLLRPHHAFARFL